MRDAETPREGVDAFVSCEERDEESNGSDEMNLNLRQGDSMELLKTIPSDSVDCMVTDPPYGISFMNKNWDKAVPDVAIWRECLRVMKPGAFAFVMCSPRSDVQAEMVIKLKEAGFEVNFTSLYWIYASGFPKAMNVSKAVDKRLGYERMRSPNPNSLNQNKEVLKYGFKGDSISEEAISEEAKRLDGSYAGYQPKPAVEVIIVAMKPLSEKTYVDQALKNGKGVTWLDDGRIPYSDNQDFEKRKRGTLKSPPFGRNGIYDMMSKETQGIIDTDQYLNESGRFPANLLVQDNALDNGIISKSGGVGGRSIHGRGEGYGFRPMGDASPELPSDEGSLSRYFSLDAWYTKNIEMLPDYVQRIYPFLYVPKASSEERSEGLNTKEQTVNDGRKKDIDNPFLRGETLRKNIHPTVKPLKLMTYILTIGSRPGDTILDPFMGSGTTGVAAKILHRDFIGFEIERKYFEIAQQRIENKAACKDILSYPYEESESIKETGEKE